MKVHNNICFRHTQFHALSYGYRLSLFGGRYWGALSPYIVWFIISTQLDPPSLKYIVYACFDCIYSLDGKHQGSPRGHGQVSGSPPDISSLRPVLRTQPVWHPLQGAQGLHPASCASLPVPQSAKRTNWPWLGHMLPAGRSTGRSTPTYQPRARLHLHHVRALPRNAECAHELREEGPTNPGLWPQSVAIGALRHLLLCGRTGLWRKPASAVQL